MKKVYDRFADEYIDGSEKSPYAQSERYTKMLGENMAKWLLKRLLKEEADRKTEQTEREGEYEPRKEK